MTDVRGAVLDSEVRGSCDSEHREGCDVDLAEKLASWRSSTSSTVRTAASEGSRRARF